MKRIEYNDLKLMGATETALQFYQNTDPLDIKYDGKQYRVSGVFEYVAETEAELITFLDELGKELND